MCAKFRRGLSERELSCAVGILSTQNMYVEDVKVTMPLTRVGRRGEDAQLLFDNAGGVRVLNVIV